MGGLRTIETGTNELLCRREAPDGRVAVITLNRPESRNALSDAMKRALAELVPRLGADPEVRVLLLTGAGGAFCAGGDTRRMAREGRPPAPEARVRQLREEHEVPRALHQMGKPTIAALPGPAAGAGLGLALACDLRLLAESAFLRSAYLQLGLSGDYGASWFLTKLAGPARAREVLFGGERIGAAECERLGLANRVLPDAELFAAALALAQQLAKMPPLALRYMKENLKFALAGSLEAALDAEAERMVQSADTEDYLDAIKAFSEKRPPRFHGSWTRG